MSQQPSLFSSTPANGSPLSGHEPTPPRPRRIPNWLRRIELFFYVVVRIYIGVIVLVLPWTPLWVNNHLINYFPRLSTLLTYGATRGMISGLGLLNLWIAVDEAVHYRESAF